MKPVIMAPAWLDALWHREYQVVKPLSSKAGNLPMPVNLFDVNYYRSVNPSLRGLSDTDATSNFW